MDFRKRRTHLTPLTIKGTDIEVVEDYKYLEVYFGNKLDCSRNTDAVVKSPTLPT